MINASLVLALSLSFGFGATRAFANKVDCTKVMAERSAGKKTKDIAKEMKISTSSVYRCKEKMTAKSTGTTAAKPAATASPASK